MYFQNMFLCCLLLFFLCFIIHIFFSTPLFFWNDENFEDDEFLRWDIWVHKLSLDMLLEKLIRSFHKSFFCFSSGKLKKIPNSKIVIFSSGKLVEDWYFWRFGSLKIKFFTHSNAFLSQKLIFLKHFDFLNIGNFWIFLEIRN